ncbi:TIGR03013 family XrtA/PEP-CTERM system glycosyltransferase [Allohahella marinimesophila]
MARVRIFRHYFYMPYMVLGLLDAAFIFAACYLAIYFEFFQMTDYFNAYALEVVSAPILFTVVNFTAIAALGVYPAKLTEGMTGMMLRTIISILAATLFIGFIVYVFSPVFWALERGVLELASLLSIFILGLWRLIFFFFVREQYFKRQVLVLGAGRRAADLIRELAEPSSRQGVSLIGFVTSNGDEVHIGEENHIFTPASLSEYCKTHPVDEIVIALDDRRKKLPLEELLECKMFGVNVIDAASFIEREVRKVALDLIQPSWMIYSDGFGGVSATQFVKRIFDIAASLVLLLVSWPIMLLTALAIKIEDGIRAPVFYLQERVGLNGKPFNVIKFRSMGTDAEKSGAVFAQKNDVRVTKVGAFVRKVRIDELPQIVNVLKGDMAFVGPRPERPVFVKQLAKNISYYNERHRVKPGITGWAQLCFAYADNEEDTKEKLRYDLYYIKNQSLLLDLIVLVQTAEVILFKKGSR